MIFQLILPALLMHRYNETSSFNMVRMLIIRCLIAENIEFPRFTN